MSQLEQMLGRLTLKTRVFKETLKDKEVYLWEYKTIEDAKRRICHFFKDVYN